MRVVAADIALLRRGHAEHRAGAKIEFVQLHIGRRPARAQVTHVVEFRHALEHAFGEGLEKTALQVAASARHLERQRCKDRELQLRVARGPRIERVEQRHRLAETQRRGAGDALAETREQRLDRLA